MADDEQIQIRCPHHPVRLLLKISKPRFVDGANMLEVSCRDCRNDRRQADPTVKLVLHLFNVMGEPVETKIVHTGGEVSTIDANGVAE